MNDLNRRYREKFGFPCIVALKLHADRAERDARDAPAPRQHAPQAELASALEQIGHIARGRLESCCMGSSPRTCSTPRTAGRAPAWKSRGDAAGRRMEGAQDRATNAEGRTDAPLLEGDQFRPGAYELRVSCWGLFQVARVSRSRAGALRHHRSRPRIGTCRLRTGLGPITKPHTPARRLRLFHCASAGPSSHAGPTSPRFRGFSRPRAYSCSPVVVLPVHFAYEYPANLAGFSIGSFTTIPACGSMPATLGPNATLPLRFSVASFALRTMSVPRSLTIRLSTR